MKNIVRLRQKYKLVVILLDNLEGQSTNARIAEEGKYLMPLNRMALPGKGLQALKVLSLENKDSGRGLSIYQKRLLMKGGML